MAPQSSQRLPPPAFLSSPRTSPEHLPQAQRRGIAAADELRRTVRNELTALVERFVTQLPVALNEAGRKAPNVPVQEACRELATRASVERAEWVTTLLAQVDAHLVGDAALPSTTASAASTHNEDAIALAGIELRAESMHRDLVDKIDGALDHIRESLYVPIHARALAPAALCRALQEAGDVLDWPSAQRRIIFETFGQVVVPELKHLYRSLLDALARIEASPPPPAADAVPKVDAETRTMLEGFATHPGASGYTDSSLALDLLALDQAKPLEGIEEEQRWVPLQRISLAGQFLNQSIADPFVSKELRPQHESVRFPLVKSALSDPTLFTAVTHPLRSLVNELMLKSATSRITGSAEARRMAELLQQVLVQFDLAPDFVRQAMLTAQPIDDQQVQRFFEMQRQQAIERRGTVVNEAKRMVVRELELRTFARAIPQQALGFLNTGWGPMMVKVLLRVGSEHAEWKSALLLTDQLLDELELREPGEEVPPEWTRLTQTVAARLASEGMTTDKIAEALAALGAAWRAQ